MVEKSRRQHLPQAMGLPATAITSVAATTGVRGHDELIIDGSVPGPQYISIGFEMKHLLWNTIGEKKVVPSSVDPCAEGALSKNADPVLSPAQVPVLLHT